MLDPKFIRENVEKVKENMINRGNDSSIVDNWIIVDRDRASLITEIEAVRKQRNELSHGLQGKPDEKTIQLVQSLKSELETKETKLAGILEEWNQLINLIPNIALPSAPKGKDESENIEVDFGSTHKPSFDFEPKDHFTLGTELNILDFESGSKVAGSQFYYLKNDAVLLEMALIQFGLSVLIEHGYELFITPDVAKSRYYLGTGYAPKGDEATTYEIDGEDLGLIATAEVTMAGYHADEVFNMNELPKKYVALSHCFRKEAGAYGKYSKGLYRVHQFSKLEMFIYCLPEQSEELHEELLKIEREIADKLEIPYRVLNMCTGDLGAIAAKKYDIEAWMPGRNDYGEITSTSNCTDYQARNLDIKYKDANGENKFVHMLNGTAVVLSRFPVAIIENNQQSDGSIKVPKVLQKWMGKEVIKSK